MSRTAATVDLQPIDRLEEKVRQLVAMIDRLKATRATGHDNARLSRRARSRARPDHGGRGRDRRIATLRDERDQVRAASRRCWSSWKGCRCRPVQRFDQVRSGSTVELRQPDPRHRLLMTDSDASSRSSSRASATR